jgi:ferredoxin
MASVQKEIEETTAVRLGADFVERWNAGLPDLFSHGVDAIPYVREFVEAVRAAGIDHPSSCEMGICGSCEVKVLGGDVDHRDDLLTDTERAQCNSMMICVSRVRGDRLVLDL